MKLKIAYFGTPDFSAYFLEKLLKDKDLPVEIKLVVTQPDKKVGKKQTLTPSAVKEIAKKNRIPVKEKVVAQDLKDLDLAALFAYGEIIPKEILDAPKHGFWNIHPSLLPKYRGAAPVAGALISGEKETGVTLMKMDEKVDHGPIIAQEKLAIEPKEKRLELTIRLIELGYQIFKRVISDVSEKSPYQVDLSTVWLLRYDMLEEQDHSKATYTAILTKKDGFIEVEKLKSKSEGQKIFNLFRGLYPWPGVWTKAVINGKEKRLKITDVNLENGQLVIKKVQLEGKNEVTFEQFQDAYGLRL